MPGFVGPKFLAFCRAHPRVRCASAPSRHDLHEGADVASRYKVLTPADHSFSRSIIVLVDDDDEITALLAERFIAAGFEVITATNGAEAIAALEDLDQLPTAMFVDLLMPGVVGHSVIDYVRSEPRFAGVPLAVVTGSPELAPAGVHVFTKPARFDALLEFARGHEGARANHAGDPNRGARVRR
jgi:CheY-like chemotaxis protein